jgi:hypothetical protein
MLCCGLRWVHQVAVITIGMTDTDMGIIRSVNPIGMPPTLAYSLCFFAVPLTPVLPVMVCAAFVDASFTEMLWR